MFNWRKRHAITILEAVLRRRNARSTVVAVKRIMM